MPQVRKAIRKTDEGNKNVCRFKHPLKLHPNTGKTCMVRFDLGDDANWRKNLEALNEIFMNEANWRNIPATTPELIRRQWLRHENSAIDRVMIEIEALRRKLDAASKKFDELTQEVKHLQRGDDAHASD